MYRPFTILSKPAVTKFAYTLQSKPLTPKKTHPCGPLSRGDIGFLPAKSSRASPNPKASLLQQLNRLQQRIAKSPLERGFRGVYRPFTILSKPAVTKFAYTLQSKPLTPKKTHPCGPLSRGDIGFLPAKSSRASPGPKASLLQQLNRLQQSTA